ncbi:MAG: hypothetical protein K940chlam9_01306 [Chlamydiae bacterium]|nr:hypothetical protein [Chlamydiota bacterium]
MCFSVESLGYNSDMKKNALTATQVVGTFASLHRTCNRGLSTSWRDALLQRTLVTCSDSWWCCDNGYRIGSRK